MRALAVALLLSVPLTAGDQSSLEKAVELFKSPDAGQRAAGSQLAERELRMLLAPLLKAMEDDDPEVRRRARRSILYLVPGEAEKDEKQQILAGVQRLEAAVRQLQAVAARARRANQLLAVFGIQKSESHYESGFRVLGVQKDSPAARLGLRKGDLIIHLNRQAVATVHNVLAALGDKPDWSRVTVTVLRNELDALLHLPKK